MLRIITLLEQKNHYLEKFFALNETELVNFRIGNFDNLESFYQTREELLKMIKYIDAQVETEPSLPPDQVNPEEKSLIRECFRTKEQYVDGILRMDLEVLECIETAKTNIIKELREVQKSKKVMGKFKSPTFNQRLSEKV